MTLCRFALSRAIASVLRNFDMDQCAVAHVLNSTSNKLRAAVSESAKDAILTGQLRLRSNALGNGRGVHSFFKGVHRMLKYAQRGFRPPMHAEMWRVVRQGVGCAYSSYLMNEVETCTESMRQLTARLQMIQCRKYDTNQQCLLHRLTADVVPVVGRAKMDICEVFPEVLAEWAQEKQAQEQLQLIDPDVLDAYALIAGARVSGGSTTAVFLSRQQSAERNRCSLANLTVS